MLIPPKVTDRAFARLAEIAQDAGGPQVLRVAVAGGGCSGFQYEITLGEPAPDDLVLQGEGQAVVVDPVSLPFLANAVIDWSDELIGARFVIENPNASSSCGCGISFTI
jgi:iron-sulfur cluster insertion protein